MARPQHDNKAPWYKSNKTMTEPNALRSEATRSHSSLIATTVVVLLLQGTTVEAEDAHLCDHLTASALDIERIVKPIHFNDIDGPRAVEACEAAVTAFPETTRFQYQLGRALARTEKHVEAQVWYLNAARRAHAAAQYSHGVGYALGRGTIQSSQKAAWWWRVAAEQTLSNAQFNLGALYEQGEGVPRDIGEAYFWYSQAAGQKNLSPVLFARYSTERDRLASTLEATELEVLAARIQAWTPGFVRDHYVRLMNTKVCPRCVLNRGDFRHLSLSQVDLHGSELEMANFRGVDMRGANLNGANLEQAQLSGANLKGANIANANLYYANLYGPTQLADANLDKSDMRNVRLMNADLTNASLRGTNLRESHFGNTIFVNANLTNANLELAKMRSANLSGANLSNANLSGADFTSSNLKGANLTGAKLNGTTFKNADLSGTDLTNAVFGETDFSGANIDTAIGIEMESAQ